MENTDDKNKTLSLRVVESEILNSYTRWKTTLNVTPKGKGSLVKWTGEYEKRDESVPEPTMYADFYIIMTNILDAYLLDAWLSMREDYMYHFYKYVSYIYNGFLCHEKAWWSLVEYYICVNFLISTMCLCSSSGPLLYITI